MSRQVMICSSSGSILTYGRRIPVAELFARIDAVDASTVKRVANRFIFDQVKPYFSHLLRDAL
ncbi:hypothetical protein GW17_00003835 [Ensete ventricosum]|nr:hypothetical protein GW17_00003835 [Ensete ventricosum]RZS04991.1 hypothetical protein BHM03_00035414 [Ensete ventricosum]